MTQNFSSEDCREGLTAVISVKHPNPQYEGQTKTKLGNSEVRKIVSTIVGEGLSQWLHENPNEAKSIIEKIRLASKARDAARLAGCSLYEHGVAVLYQLLNSCRGHAYPVLIVLDFFWNSDNHKLLF